MRYLIAQGPGYYGVNIRLITEEQADSLIKNGKFTPVDVSGDGYTHALQTDNGTVLILTESLAGLDAASEQSLGFDTGWWEEGEKALNEVIK